MRICFDPRAFPREDWLRLAVALPWIAVPLVSGINAEDLLLVSGINAEGVPAQPAEQAKA